MEMSAAACRADVIPGFAHTAGQPQEGQVLTGVLEAR